MVHEEAIFVDSRAIEYTRGLKYELWRCIALQTSSTTTDSIGFRIHHFGGHSGGGFLKRRKFDIND
jgi:hypothetical protein